MSDYKTFKANFEYHKERSSKGFGDTVEKITKATGIKKVVDTVAEALDADCGCDKRKKKLNELFPYKMPELFTEQEFLYLQDIFIERKNDITEYAPRMLEIYNRVFNEEKKLTNCSPCFVGQVYNKLEAIYNEYK